MEMLVLTNLGPYTTAGIKPSARALLTATLAFPEIALLFAFNVIIGRGL
jgi:hypothetical protein